MTALQKIFRNPGIEYLFDKIENKFTHLVESHWHILIKEGPYGISEYKNNTRLFQIWRRTQYRKLYIKYEQFSEEQIKNFDEITNII